MPNWCYNKVTISGDAETIKKFVDNHINTDTPFFQSIMPMPQELVGTISPRPRTTEQVLADSKQYEWDAETTQWHLDNALTKEMEKHLDNLKDKYGADNWYSWCCDNWGVKWDVGKIDDVYVDIDGEDGRVELSFDTAWGPPEGIYHKLYEMYPDVHITWFFDEPGMEFAGYLKEGGIDNGC
jgi:hypothetical protein